MDYKKGREIDFKPQKISKNAFLRLLGAYVIPKR
jgi:hypothetical protein